MGFIYCITNKINNKKYVGQTKTSIGTRFKAHLNDYRNDDRCALHYAMQKYGKENFIVETLEECNDNVLDDREIFWIEKLNTYKEGYNSTLGGQSRPLKYDYKIISEKYSELKSYKKTAEYFNCSYRTVKEACKVNQTPDFSNHISTAQEQVIIDYLFKNKFDVNKTSKKFKCSEPTVYNILKRNSINLKKEKDLYIISTYKRLGSIAKTVKETGRSEFYISKVLTQNNVPRIATKQSKKRVGQFTLDNVFIKEFTSVKEAGQIIGINYKNIASVCRGERATAGGYKWRYI